MTVEQFNDIRELFEKHMQGGTEPGLQAALYEALENHSREEITDVLESIAAGFPADPNFNIEAWESMIAGILRAEPTRKKSAKVFGLNPWWAAASVTIVISVAAYFILTPVRKKETTTQTITRIYKNDVAPGGNKAMLTLSNGATIILDSAHIGKLADQGNAKVVKLDSGKIAYTAAAAKSNEVVYNTLTTPKGGQYQLELPDHSRVWLNAASSIRYPTAFTGRSREVEITGEAYFEVRHDGAKPFVVTKNQVSVTVIGTHFNVSAYDDDENIKVTLLEGAVKVAQHNNNPTTIKPGEQAMVTNNGSIAVLRDVDTDLVMAWKNGKFSFDNTSLETILKEFSRWYDVKVVYEGKIPERKFFGIMNRSSSLVTVLGALQANNIGFELEGRTLKVK